MYSRRNRWSKNRVPDRVCERLQHEQILRIKIEAVFLDSALGNVHPDGTGKCKKTGPQAIGKSRGGRTAKLPVVAAHAQCALLSAFSRQCRRCAAGPVLSCRPSERRKSRALSLLTGLLRAMKRNERAKNRTATRWRPPIPIAWSLGSMAKN